MPYTDARSGPPSRPHLDVLRIAWSPDPDEMARALEPLRARLLGLARARSEAAQRARAMPTSERRQAAEVLESLAREGEQVLAEIESLEAAKARLEADLLSAYAALHTVEEQQIAALPAGSPSRMTGKVSTGRVVGEEIALATGVGVGEVSRRLTLATSPRRHRTMLAALRAGATSLHRALQVASETATLSDEDVRVVEEAVLAPSRDGLPVPQRTFVTRLRRAVASVDGRGSAERRTHAQARRGVFGRLTGDGMGCLTLVADADAVAAVMDRLDTQARAARAAGDPRGLDQLRCDLATEALLRSHLTAHQPDSASCSDGLDAPQVGDAGSGRSAALVWLVVPFEVAAGTSESACELPGHGWVTAAHAREIMTRSGSVWRTLPVDVESGRALVRPSKGYRPTRAMVEQVQALDGVCRGPGCEVLASRCDLDHETPWPEGETAVGNLFTKHRLHHNLKTGGIWTSRPVTDADHDGPPVDRGLEWTTLTGRTYVTSPKDWREGLPPPEPQRAHPPEPDDPPPF
ncbi:HNH endonuclease signature motif containing protein [Terrabacter lapilli]|uniref:HNH endonuclease signature motif containing protein n=1 Tax=Terrabacter lapilli TaxID=436231 RepID=A0ABN2S5M7_9MICO